MNHIKLFEGYLESGFYEEISKTEAYDLIKDSKLVWDVSKEIMRINSHLDGFHVGSGIWGTRDVIKWKDKNNIISRDSGRIFINYFYNTHWQNFYITPVDDDYWIVFYTQWNYKPEYMEDWKYFKCDQFDGLLKFLKDHHL